ncbi:MAG TPA: Holliday junction resolvase RuvX [Acidimicrobiia bacterium]|nr:Holliday junction resolvase RuvX [Acidimicrobiia bacterium]
MGRVLALDHGSVRIGVAVSDAAGIAAHPRGHLSASGPVVEQVCELIAELEIERIVVGLPVSLDGSEGPSAAAARAFAAEIAEATGVPTELVDERFTTAIAERAMIETDTRRDRRRELRDGAAAAVLLQDWLERR